MTEFIKNNYKILIGIILGLILVVLLIGCKKDNLNPSIQPYIESPIDSGHISPPSERFINKYNVSFETTSPYFNIYINNVYKGIANYEGQVKTGDTISIRIYKNDLKDNDNITLFLGIQPIVNMDDWIRLLEINDTCTFNHLIK